MVRSKRCLAVLNIQNVIYNMDVYHHIQQIGSKRLTIEQKGANDGNEIWVGFTLQ